MRCIELDGGDSGPQIFAKRAKRSASEPVGFALDLKISWGASFIAPDLCGRAKLAPEESNYAAFTRCTVDTAQPTISAVLRMLLPASRHSLIRL